MISIGLYEGEGANPDRLETCLNVFGFAVRRVHINDFGNLPCLGIEVLYLPGGWYRFDDHCNEQIVEWVRGGGGIVGTCAGSYLVGAQIGLFPSRVLRCNFRGRLYLEPRQGSHPILRDVVRPCTRHNGRPHGEQIAVTHLGGPLILPEDKNAIVASYDFEGEVGAIVATAVEQGKAVAIASHPELELAALPDADCEPLKRMHTIDLLPQGDARLLIRNAVLWAARQDTGGSE
jgi:glutamine amidotransferase-like uncharacterized protein